MDFFMVGNAPTPSGLGFLEFNGSNLGKIHNEALLCYPNSRRVSSVWGLIGFI